MTGVASVTEGDRQRAAKIGTELMHAFYESREQDLVYDCNLIKHFLEAILKKSGFSGLAVDAKAKERNSAVEKISRKCFDMKSNYAQRILAGEHPSEIVTDLVRARVTCRFSDQIDQVAAIIRGNLILSESDEEDHRTSDRFDAFGYAALHLIGMPVQGASTNMYFSGCKFELQVRSALMDIWGVVNWDIAYESQKEVPFEIKRRLSSVSALFYLIDREFIGIRDGSLMLASDGGQPPKEDLERELDASLVSALKKRQIQFSEDEVLNFRRIKARLSTEVDTGRLSYLLQVTDQLVVYLLDTKKFRWVVEDNVVELVDKLNVEAVVAVG